MVTFLSFHYLARPFGPSKQNVSDRKLFSDSNGRWIFSPHVLSGHCTVQKGIFEINARKGGTNRFRQHVLDRDKITNRKTTSQVLDGNNRKKTTQAAAW